MPMEKSQQKMLNRTVSEIVDVCMATGIHKSMFSPEKERTITHMPVSLFPYELSKNTYDLLAKAHLIWAKLLAKVSYDKQFVTEVFAAASKKDDFLNRILGIYERQIEKQETGMIVLRVDYMGDQRPELVEFNLISVGLNNISEKVQVLTSLVENSRLSSDSFLQYPKSTNQKVLMDALDLSIKKTQKGVIIMVVHQDFEKQFNFGDQVAFLVEAAKRGHIVKKVPLNVLMKEAKLNPKSGDLQFEGERVAVVYYRTCYSPDHYPTEQHWKFRETVEESNAVSIPTISMQLINFKRMQAELSDIKVLRRFLTEEQAQIIKSINGEIINFEKYVDIDDLIEKTSKTDYVLKPNREGGGNNYFGAEVSEKLKELKNDPQQLQKYVLMNKIPSTTSDNYFISNGKAVYVQQASCQFSTFGSFVHSKGQILFNEFGGSLSRLKHLSENQGGIAIDKAAISGVCLFKSK